MEKPLKIIKAILKKLIRIQLKAQRLLKNYIVQFILLGIFSFLAYYILSGFKILDLKTFNWLIANAFSDWRTFVEAVFTLILGFVGLLFAVIAAILLDYLKKTIIKHFTVSARDLIKLEDKNRRTKKE